MAKYANSVHVIFGDPSAPGTFVQTGDDPMEPSGHPLHPLRLRGIESGGEVEVVGFFREDTPNCPDSSWIVVSNSAVSSIYRNLTADPQSPAFAEPVQIYDGGDPEDLLASDLFPDPDDLPDLAILDEGKGELVLLRNRGCGDITPKFELAGMPFEIGSPQGIAEFKKGETLSLAALSRSRQSIFIYERNCDAVDTSDCAFTPARTIDLVEPEVHGDHNVLSCARGAAGGVLIASLVEDAPKRIGQPAIDFTLVGGLPPEGGPVVPVGLPRVDLEATEDPPALVLLGRFLGDDDVPDLLLACESGAIDLYPGSAEGQAPQDPPPEGQEPVPPVGEGLTMDLSIGGEPADGEVVLEKAGKALVALATASRVNLFRFGPDEEAGLEWSFEQGPDKGIRRIAHGWLRSSEDTEDFRGNLFLVLLGDQSLTAVMVTEDEDGGVALDLVNPQDPPGRLDTLGIRDVNLDGLDDILAIDGTRSTIEVFLSLEGGPGLRFGPGQKFSYAAAGALPVDLAFLDANGDLLPDLCFGAKSGEVILFLGEGDGTFGDPQGFFAGPGVEGVRSLDLDGDGREESILVSSTIPGLVVLTPGGGRP
jgi:hypothetical protein